MPERSVIPPYLDIEERRALATQWDYEEDFDKPTFRGTCNNCMHVFIGLPCRIDCRVCPRKEKECSPS